MNNRHVMGRDGLALAILLSLAMFALAYFEAAPQPLAGDTGICFPSPNLWGLNALWGWVANMASLLTAWIVLALVNKEFTIVQGSDTVLTGMFAIMTSSNLWLSGALSSSGILALANLICLVVLFGCYRKQNATQEMFLIASILAIGSMFQYAFIFMMPAYLIGAIMMKCFRFKTFIAFLMGIAAPYWIALGFGIVNFDDFTMPTFTNLFNGHVTKFGLLVGLINIGATVLIGLVLVFLNWVKLYAGNTQRRLYNMVVNVLGFFCVMCIIIDFNNMVAYLATMYMIAAVQLGNFFALRNVYRGNRVVIVLCLLYILGFTLMVWGNWFLLLE